MADMRIVEKFSRAKPDGPTLASAGEICFGHLIAIALFSESYHVLPLLSRIARRH